MFSQRACREHCRAEFRCFGLWKYFSEKISEHLLSGDILKFDPALVNAVADVVELDKYVSHACGRPIGNAESRLVVHKECCWWKLGNM